MKTHNGGIPEHCPNTFPAVAMKLLALALFILFLAAPAFSVELQYGSTGSMDFMTDAPWRVKGKSAAVPFGFFIKNTGDDALDHLNSVTVRIVRESGSQTVYHRDFGGIAVDKPFWEHVTRKFQNAYDPALNGKFITAANLGFGDGGVMVFEAVIRAEQDSSPIEFVRRLRVFVEKSFPRPDSNWLYGDAHYHTRFTSNPYEYGAGLTTLKHAMSAMDLDWLTITDHASDHSDFLTGSWDLNATKWKQLKAAVAKLVTDGLPFIVGEEIACRPVAGVNEDAIHMLVYNNSAFISGEVDILNNARYSLASRLDALNSTGLAFAAHPKDSTNYEGIGNIVPWSAGNYTTAYGYPTFFGLEVWNTRTTMYTAGGDVMNINPFTGAGGGWVGQFPSGAGQSHFLPNLNKGLTAWEGRLKANLNPIRKSFVIAGSDAHGDINYTTRRSVEELLSDCTDNAIGKVRTLVYAPLRTRASVLAGLRNGRSLITDGPTLLIGVDKNGDGKLNKSDGDLIMGDTANIAGGGSILVIWQAYESGHERSWVTGRKGIAKVRLIVDGVASEFYPASDPAVVGGPLKGRRVFALPALQAGNHYVRAECLSYEFVNESGFRERYRAYTNPVWVV